MKKSNYCTFYIVRHGKTEWNTKGLIQGQKDSPLTQEGEEQAALLRAKLQHIRFDAVYSSDSLRAKRTAELIALERAIIIQTTALLRERTNGKYEGKPYKAKSKFNEYYETLSQEEKYSYKADGVESDEELIERLIRFIREAAVSHAGETILLVTHGDAIHKLLIHFGYGTYKNFPLVDSIKNTAYFTVESDGSDFFIKETNGIAPPITE